MYQQSQLCSNNNCVKEVQREVALSCGHFMCQQCLRQAHVQTQIQNQNSLGSEKNKTNQLNCPKCNTLTFLSNQEYQYLQSILLHEITVQDEQNVYQESFNFNQAPNFVQNQINNEDEFENEEVRQQNLKQKEEIQAQIEKLNEQISQKQKKLEILRVESKRKQDSQLQTQIIVLKQSTKVKQFLEALQLNIPIDQGVSQLQKLNEDLKQKKEQNQQQLTNLISKNKQFDQKHFENVQKNYNEMQQYKKENQGKINQRPIIFQKPLQLQQTQDLKDLKDQIERIKQENQAKSSVIQQKQMEFDRLQKKLGQPAQYCINCYEESSQLLQFSCKHSICFDCFIVYLGLVSFLYEQEKTKTIDLKCATCDERIDSFLQEKLEKQFPQLLQEHQELWTRIKRNQQMLYQHEIEKNTQEKSQTQHQDQQSQALQESNQDQFTQSNQISLKLIQSESESVQAFLDLNQNQQFQGQNSNNFQEIRDL